MEQVTFASFIGQQSIKNDLEVRIAAAKIRNAPLDHFLLCGADQIGKLTFAKTIAPEMGANARILDATMERVGDLASMLTHLREGDIWLIEDVELLRRPMIPILAEAAQNFAMDITIGKGPAAKNVRLNLPHFTVIGTSSHPSRIDRQVSQVLLPRYDFTAYTISDMSQLVSTFSIQFGLKLQHDAAELIARYCEGTPGKAKVLVKRIADYCLVKAPFIPVNLNLATTALTHLGYSPKNDTPSELGRRLNAMDGIEFEEFTAQFFRTKGYTTEMTQVSGDHGIDIFARKGQDYIGIQCKRWTNPVGEPVIRDFYGALLNSEAKAGFVFATSGFTRQAIDFVQGKPIRLVDLDKFIQLLTGSK
ncbi:MAG: restriction endonuclease [Chloroflexota bacterium]